MSNKFLCFVFSCLFALTACGEKPTPPPDGPSVGLQRLSLLDPIRQNWSETGPRPLVTSIWYPAAETAQMAEIVIPPKRPVFIGGYAARNAPMAEAERKHPLIVMSHGTGGAAMQMMWLGRELAAQGYIVVAIDHHGNTAAEEVFDPRGFRMPWERAKDVTTVLDLLLSDPKWNGHIDIDRIGAIGFSLGGYTVTALAGGRLNLERFTNFCKSESRDATCDEQSEFPEAGEKFDAMVKSDTKLAARLNEHGRDYSDKRIKAVLTLAPAIAQALTEESLSDIEVPFLTVVGALDEVAPAQTNAHRLTKFIPNAKIETLEQGNHYAFLNRCNRRGLKYVPICKTDGTTSREQLHKQTIGFASDFFNTTLAPKP